MNVINFEYEGNEIPFKMNEDGQVFMNATEMAKPFPDKKMNNFLRNRSTIDYINAIHKERGDTLISASADSELVITKKGGNDQGTWFHENIALRFAQWLNPKFSVWCDKRIKEILNQGFSALTQKATDYIDDQVGKEVQLMNNIVAQIQTGVKKPGKAMQDFMRYVEGVTIKIAYMDETVLKNSQCSSDKKKLLKSSEGNSEKFIYTHITNSYQGRNGFREDILREISPVPKMKMYLIYIFRMIFVFGTLPFALN